MFWRGRHERATRRAVAAERDRALAAARFAEAEHEKLAARNAELEALVHGFIQGWWEMNVGAGAGDDCPATEELTMIALALKNQGVDGDSPERGVELLIERLYRVERGVDALRRHLVTDAAALPGGAAAQATSLRGYAARLGRLLRAPGDEQR